MNFKRKISENIKQWKIDNVYKKKALIIKGLRQVGKTFIVNQFAKDNYENIIYINFKSHPNYKKIFQESLDINDILFNMSIIFPNSKFVEGKTVFIFDEIQECSSARSSLKFFCLDGRFDVIATGSLLGIKGYNRDIGEGPSTGFETTLIMKPMDFEEFCWAKGIDENSLNKVKELFINKKEIPSSIHDRLSLIFKQYMCVGGMPSIVDTFLTYSDLSKVKKEQHDLLESYKDDFGKYISKDGKESINGSLLAKINTVFNSIPSQLAKENKKFSYNELGKYSKKSIYEEAIQWLIDFGLVVPCYCLNNLQLPLEGNKNPDIYKLYFADTGLFLSSLNFDIYPHIINDDLNIYKGCIYENIIADALNKNGSKLYYYKKDSGLEIDFIEMIDNKLSAIEVKAKSGKSKSLNEVLTNKTKYSVDYGYKISKTNISKNGNIIHMPHYLCYLLF